MLDARFHCQLAPLQVCSAESMGVGREFGPTAQFSTDRRCQQTGEKEEISNPVESPFQRCGCASFRFVELCCWMFWLLDVVSLQVENAMFLLVLDLLAMMHSDQPEKDRQIN